MNFRVDLAYACVPESDAFMLFMGFKDALAVFGRFPCNL